MHKSEEISDMLFSLCLRSVRNFCLFLCTCVSDVLQPGVTCLWKSWLFMLSTIFSKYYNLGVWGGGFLPCSTLHFFLWFLWFVFCCKILSRHCGFVFGIRCLMYVEVLSYNLCSVIHDNTCTETDDFYKVNIAVDCWIMK